MNEPFGFGWCAVKRASARTPTTILARRMKAQQFSATVMITKDTDNIAETLDPLLVSSKRPISYDARKELIGIPMPDEADQQLRQAWEKIKAGAEDDIPSMVSNTAKFFHDNAIEVGVSRKGPTVTCDGAVACRLTRDGKLGISAKHELKALAYMIEKPKTWKGHLVLVNLANDVNLKSQDELKMVIGQQLINGKLGGLTFASKEILKKQFMAYKGAVNAASIAVNSSSELPVIFIFDSKLLSPDRRSEVMFTNMGCNTWSTSFQIGSLYDALEATQKHVYVLDVSTTGNDAICPNSVECVLSVGNGAEIDHQGHPRAGTKDSTDTHMDSTEADTSPSSFCGSSESEQ
mmetsp:Transcript_79824/g.171080  ORF Transcript_79824/g.171080 Transcript_79824/m.171080 type:complete len:348 (-) Transcript_79824:513-1556(-)